MKKMKLILEKMKEMAKKSFLWYLNQLAKTGQAYTTGFMPI
jgi:hypothetical protein